MNEGELMKSMLFVLFVCALLVACNAPTEQAPQDTPEAQEPAPETESDVEADIEVDSNLPDDVKEKMMDFFTGTPEYYVLYDYTMDMHDFDGAGEMAMYMDGERMRTDMDFQGMESRTIFDGDIITCTKDGSWSCMKIDEDMMDESVSAPTEQVDVESNMADIEVTDMSTRTIAGVMATCFTFVLETHKYEICYAKEGAMLYMHYEDENGKMEYVAKEYRKSVSDSDFNPPAEPQSMEDMMGDYGMPDGFEMPSY